MERKEITFRNWFSRKYGNVELPEDKKERYVLPRGISEIEQSFKNDLIGYSISFNSVMKYARNIEEEVKSTGTYEIPPLQEDVEEFLDMVYQDEVRAVNGKKKQQMQQNTFELNIQSMDDIGEVDVKLYKTNTIIDEIDSDFEIGGGQYGGTVTVVVGESGAGKTTFLMDKLAKYKMANPDINILFISTEMTRNDLRFWKLKMPHLNVINIALAMDYMLRGQLKQFTDAVFLQKDMSFDIIVLDSFQDLLVKFKESLGWRETTTQGYLVRTMISAAEDKGTAIYAIQHATKSGTYVGSTFLKHTTTAMMHIEFYKSKGSDNDGRRCVYYSKNRRGGSVQAMPIFFEMNKEGMLEYDEKEFNNLKRAKESAKENKAALDEKAKEMMDFINKVQQEAEKGEDSDDAKELNYGAPNAIQDDTPGIDFGEPETIDLGYVEEVN